MLNFDRENHNTSSFNLTNLYHVAFMKKIWGALLFGNLFWIYIFEKQ